MSDRSPRAVAAPASQASPASPASPGAAPVPGALPPYELRVSARARRATLSVLPGRGLVVSVPRRFARRDVPALVAEHREWALAELAALEARVPAAFRTWPPRALELPAIGHRLVIGFDARAGAAPCRATPSSLGTETVLTLGGPPEDREAACRALAAWLAAEARARLGARLAELAERHGLPFDRLSIRGQRTLWGSCSSSGTISLNWKLLFLSPRLVDYVLLHELAHTRHMNQSGAFWALLERLAPGARALDAELREAGPRVPPWFEKGVGNGGAARR